ncbi:MAG: DNA polymerase III subunit gamma/tau [Acidobacteriota bacterium]
MAYQALARKYRPQRFSDIIGQETVVRTLQNAIEQKRIHHAYLFSGVRGVGKTTAARILAKALNCAAGPTIEPDNVCSICSEITEGIDLDVREIDAATYTGVDNIRDLREVTQFQPARDRYRIFIIDEAHMLSAPAWNALLKILEEPPPFVIFMFATTEINKVPQTILSRVQKFMLRKITLDELIEQLAGICRSEGIEAEREALEIVARRGEGSVRDALSLLDQIIAFSGRAITSADVTTILGLSDTTFFARIVGLIGEGNHAGILNALQEAADGGRDFKMLYRDLLNFVRNLLLITGGASSSMLTVSPEDLAALSAAAEQFSYPDLLRIANLLLRDDETVNRSEHQRLAVELALLKAATFPRMKSVEQLLASGGATSSASTSTIRPAATPAPRQATQSAREESAPRRAPVTRREPAQAPKELEAPPMKAANPKAGTADIATLIAQVRKVRPMIGTYLSDCLVRHEGNRITFTFDEIFKADSVNDAKAAIEEIAGEVFGSQMSVEAVVAKEQPQTDRRAAPAEEPGALREDPVVKAFAKHLGGEVVETRKR